MDKVQAISRRSLLLGLAAASATAATVGTAVAAEATPPENPELMRLGDRLPRVIAEYAAASNALAEIIATWSPRWPLAPKELRMDRVSAHHWERGLTGETLNRPDGVPWSIYDSAELDRDIAYLRKTLRRKRRPGSLINWYGTTLSHADWQPHLQAMLDQSKVAARYETKKQRVLEASAYVAADLRCDAARRALQKAPAAIMAEQERSMAGIVVKAQALAAWASVDRLNQHFTFGAVTWGTDLAASVLHIAGEAPATHV